MQIIYNPRFFLLMFFFHILISFIIFLCVIPITQKHIYKLSLIFSLSHIYGFKIFVCMQCICVYIFMSVVIYKVMWRVKTLTIFYFQHTFLQYNKMCSIILILFFLYVHLLNMAWVCMYVCMLIYKSNEQGNEQAKARQR